MDRGSEVTLCHEELSTKLEICGKKLNFKLTGMKGSQKVESQVVDIVVESIDGSTSVVLQNLGPCEMFRFQKGAFREEKIQRIGIIKIQSCFLLWIIEWASASSL